MDLYGQPALERVIQRLRQAKTLNDVIVATTTNETDDPIVNLCEKLNCHYYRGSEEDVLTRVLEAARKFEVDIIVEITGDCPFIDWNHIDVLVTMHKTFLQESAEKLVPYDIEFFKKTVMTMNIAKRSFPRGYDVRVFNREALERVNEEVDNPVDRQHVSTFAYLNPKGKEKYMCLNWEAPPGQHRPDLQITLDTPEDLELIRWLFSFESQGYNLELTCEQVISILDQYPDKLAIARSGVRKDYYEELAECYKNMGEVKKEDVQCADSGSRKSRGFKRYTGKPKPKQDNKLRPRGKGAPGV